MFRCVTICSILLSIVNGPEAVAEEPHVIELVQQWEVGSGDDAEVVFGVISGLAVDAAGNVYVVDRQLDVVSRISAAGVFQGPFGREGEGPGEYRRIGDVFASGPAEMAVMQRMPGKIVTLTTDGLPGEPISLPPALEDAPAYFFNGRRVGDDVLILANQMKREDGGIIVERSLIRIDRAGEEVARLSVAFEQSDLSDFRIDEKSHAPAIWDAAPHGHVFVSDEFDAYSVRVYDEAGTLLRTLARSYDHRRRSAEEIRQNTPRMAVMSRDGDRRDAVGTASETDRDLQALFARPDGTLWVLTSRGAFDPPAGILVTCEVFTAAGEYSHQVALRGDGDFRDDALRIIGDRVYLMRGLRAARLADRGEGVEEEDAEPMSIVCYEMKGVD